MNGLRERLDAKTSLIVLVCLYSIAAIPAVAGSRLDGLFAALSRIPLFLYNEDFTTISVKEEQFNYLSFTRLTSLLFVAFALHRFTRKRPPFTFELTPIDIPFLLLILYRIVSEFAIGVEVNYSLLSYMLVALVLYVLLAADFDEQVASSLYKAFALVGVVNAVVIIWQAYAIKMTIGDFILRDFSNQPRGMLMDAVVASIYMTVSVVILLENMVAVRAATRVVLILLLVVASILTGSRGFLIMLAIYAGVRHEIFFGSLRRAAVSLAAGLLIGVGGFVAFGEELRFVADNFQTLVNFQEDLSSMSRKDKLESSLRLFQENPVFGIGSNNFQAYTDSAAALDETLTDNPHNVYAQILAENGLVGGILLAWIAFIVISNWKRLDGSLRVVLLVLCIGIGYIGALGSLPLVVVLVGLMCACRNGLYPAAGRAVV